VRVDELQMLARRRLGEAASKCNAVRALGSDFAVPDGDLARRCRKYWAGVAANSMNSGAMVVASVVALVKLKRRNGCSGGHHLPFQPIVPL
jgi:hypothetical protein